VIDTELFNIQTLKMLENNAWLAIHPESSLRDFHEAFLNYGNPPNYAVAQGPVG